MYNLIRNLIENSHFGKPLRLLPISSQIELHGHLECVEGQVAYNAWSTHLYGWIWHLLTKCVEIYCQSLVSDRGVVEVILRWTIGELLGVKRIKTIKF